MNKRERTQLIKKANKDFGRPFIIEADDNNGQIRYGAIQTTQDERLFIDFGASHREWFARNLKSN